MSAQILSLEGWLSTGDGFFLCPRPLSVLLKEKGIRHTGISPLNRQDADSYYDDWHLICVEEPRPVFGLIKLREQEHDFRPGFSDRDDPSVTVSFVAFCVETLLDLPNACPAQHPAMAAFVNAFRNTTERFPQIHSEVLQRYFSDPASEGSYLIARCYIQKLLTLYPSGKIPFPDRSPLASSRLRRGLEKINHAAGRDIADFSQKEILLADPAALTLEEQQVLLALHTGNLTFASFAAEVEFHADALVSWEAKIPVAGKKIWYRAAIRADMQFGPENRLYSMIFCPYYHAGSRLLKKQEALHGKR